jgi:O-antigen/teichoic acid export membrane protein
LPSCPWLLPWAGVAGLGVTGILMGSAAVTAVAAVWTLRRTSKTAGAPVEVLRGDLGRAGVALILFWAMASIDVPLARHFLHPHEAGQYAAASVIGKAIIWLPGALSLVMFPRVTSRRERGEHTHPPLIRAMAATFVLCAVGVLGLKVLGPTMIPLFFGNDYRESVSLAWRVGLVCLPFALANLLLFYHLTRGTALFLVGVVVSLVVELVSLALFHDSPEAIVSGLGAGGVALLLCLLVPGIARRMGFRMSRAPVIGIWFSASTRSR